MAAAGSQIDGQAWRRVATVIKCLGHPTRLRLAELLDGRERSVSELVAGVGATQSAVSHQLATLRAHGMVEGRRDGSFVRYRITEPTLRHIVDCIRRFDEPGLRS